MLGADRRPRDRHRDRRSLRADRRAVPARDPLSRRHGGHEGSYIRSEVWFGGQPSVVKTGYARFATKLALEETYLRTVGKPPTVGVPATELLGELSGAAGAGA